MPDHKSADTCENETNPIIDPIDDIRTQLRHLLPRAVHNAVTSYQEFSQNISPDDAKQFIAHHNACRAALVHLESLSKLTRWLINQHPQASDAADLQPLLLQARQVLTRLEHPDSTDHSNHDENDDDNSDDSTTEF